MSKKVHYEERGSEKEEETERVYVKRSGVSTWSKQSLFENKIKEEGRKLGISDIESFVKILQEIPNIERMNPLMLVIAYYLRTMKVPSEATYQRIYTLLLAKRQEKAKFSGESTLTEEQIEKYNKDIIRYQSFLDVIFQK